MLHYDVPGMMMAVMMRTMMLMMLIRTMMMMTMLIIKISTDVSPHGYAALRKIEDLVYRR